MLYVYELGETRTYKTNLWELYPNVNNKLQEIFADYGIEILDQGFKLSRAIDLSTITNLINQVVKI